VIKNTTFITSKFTKYQYFFTHTNLTISIAAIIPLLVPQKSKRAHNIMSISIIIMGNIAKIVLYCDCLETPW
jgi:hypothetical protein